MTNKYEVVVGNIGTVYRGTDLQEATKVFETYCIQSNQFGRASGEDVTLFENGEPLEEFEGRISREQQDI